MVVNFNMFHGFDVKLLYPLHCIHYLAHLGHFCNKSDLCHLMLVYWEALGISPHLTCHVNYSFHSYILTTNIYYGSLIPPTHPYDLTKY